MDDLTAFVTARLDEDEAAAKAATGPDWHADNTALQVFTRQQATGDRPGVRGVAWCSNGYADDSANATHIARHDPARALREVTAKRAIVAAYEREGMQPIHRPDPEVLPLIEARLDALEDAMLSLAAVWSDHPDYKQEWAPLT